MSKPSRRGALAVTCSAPKHGIFSAHQLTKPDLPGVFSSTGEHQRQRRLTAPFLTQQRQLLSIDEG